MSGLLKLATRMYGVESSPTVRLNALAQEMIKSGKDIINLTAGETDFDTSENVKKAAITALERGMTRYTPPHGIPELRRAAVEWFQKEFSLSYKPDEVTVSVGVKQGIFNLMLATVGAGDEVIIPSPYWVSYPEMVRIAGGTPVIVSSGLGFSLNLEEIKNKINSKTRLLILNSPNNPSGYMCSREELQKLASFLVGTNVLVASDEIYSSLVYDAQEFQPFAALSVDAKARTITFNGLSKSHAMTGWRVGFAAGDKKIIDALGILQAQSSTHITSFVQWAAVEALKQTRQEFAPHLEEMQKRRDLCVLALQKIKGVQIDKPKGAFYLFPEVAPYAEKLGGSDLVAEYLLKEAGVAVVPGKPFGDDKRIRISFAKDIVSLEKAMNRIAGALQKL